MGHALFFSGATLIEIGVYNMKQANRRPQTLRYFCPADSPSLYKRIAASGNEIGNRRVAFHADVLRASSHVEETCGVTKP